MKRAVVAVALLVAGAARAEIDFKFGGMIASDIRYRLKGEPVNSPYPSQYQLLRYGFSRNENLIKSKLSLKVGSKVAAVGDVDLYLYGYSDAHNLDGLTLRERVDPWRLEVNAAYVDIYRILPGLDLRIGRQVVMWGTADQFNPTNNLNSLDLSDPLLFGRVLANNMLRLDWNPKGDWVMTAVWVPIFRPALLPRSAPVALRAIDRPPPIQEEDLRDALYNLSTVRPPRELEVSTYQPEVSLANSQVGVRFAGRVGGQDLSLSYYHGRFGIPQLAASVNRADGVADVTVMWPRMDVVGADIAGTFEKLGGVGYWAEGALIFPQLVDYALYDDRADGSRSEVRFGDQGRLVYIPVDRQGRYTESPSGVRSTIIPSTPFFKLTVGGDLSIGRHVYLNVQYLHGFVDEFGNGKAVHARLRPNDLNEIPRVDQRIGDYIVAGFDVKLFQDRLLLRVFGVAKLPSLNISLSPGPNESAVTLDAYKPTGVLFPQIAWTVWEATDLILGAYVLLGDRDTKFGDPAAGASEIFAKARFSY